jgi:hypothetical protein
MKDRWCQRASCGKLQRLYDFEDPKPCRQCGGTNFGAQPPLHSRSGWRVTKADFVTLKVNGIAPEIAEDDCDG